jgi:hypothetical protein
VPALRKTRDIYGSKPLPAHFGEIDTKAPFDPERHFTALRCAGHNPHLWRAPDKKVQFIMDCWREESPLQAKLFATAVAWAHEQDSDHGLRSSFLRKIADALPVGGIAYLG